MLQEDDNDGKRSCGNRAMLQADMNLYRTHESNEKSPSDTLCLDSAPRFPRRCHGAERKVRAPVTVHSSGSFISSDT
jgi:hypothetical protein